MNNWRYRRKSNENVPEMKDWKIRQCAETKSLNITV